jgi:hypothetical protein
MKMAATADSATPAPMARNPAAGHKKHKHRRLPLISTESPRGKEQRFREGFHEKIHVFMLGSQVVRRT